MKKTAKGIFLKGEGATDEGHARAVAKQRAWAREAADGIERGKLPAAEDERQMLAAILRSAADHLPERRRKRRGNPGKLLPDDDTLAIVVRMCELRGEKQADALRAVAQIFDVDDSTVAKICRARRAAVDGFLPLNSRRVFVLGKGRRNIPPNIA